MTAIGSLLAMLAVLAVVATACSDSEEAADTSSSETIDKNPQVDRDPTPDTGTGGEQQGTVPSQLAQ